MTDAQKGSVSAWVPCKDNQSLLVDGKGGPWRPCPSALMSAGIKSSDGFHSVLTRNPYRLTSRLTLSDGSETTVYWLLVHDVVDGTADLAPWCEAPECRFQLGADFGPNGDTEPRYIVVTEKIGNITGAFVKFVDGLRYRGVGWEMTEDPVDTDFVRGLIKQSRALQSPNSTPLPPHSKEIRPLSTGSLKPRAGKDASSDTATTGIDTSQSTTTVTPGSSRILPRILMRILTGNTNDPPVRLQRNKNQPVDSAEILEREKEIMAKLAEEWEQDVFGTDLTDAAKGPAES